MGQSLHQVYAHIVFSTKNREPLISENMESEMYAYLVGVVKNLGGAPIIINGMPDHVHLLIRTSKSITDSDFIQKLKASSSKWAREHLRGPFAWQTGYGWFSVSAKDVEAAKLYIQNQKEHHRSISFKEEFVRFLNKYGIDFDEKYLWVE